MSTSAKRAASGALFLALCLPTTGWSAPWWQPQRVVLHAGQAFDPPLIAEQTRLPFVTLAPLGQETRAFDSGFLADSHARELEVELAVRLRSRSGISPLFFFRGSSGSETVDLTRGIGEAPQRIDVEQGGYRPIGIGPRWSGLIGFSVEFGLGGGLHSSPAADP